ncbi:hypothetical protein [Nocardioides baekrokdamisoli]|nr:hypothetical protein [Nocardioides baekrokdamisoli]
MAAYGVGDRPMSSYEMDHETPIEVGGSPGSLLNLWPEPNDDRRLFGRNQYVNNDKDHVESTYGRGPVCAGTVTLEAVQKAFALDWTTVPALPGRRM